MSVLYEIEGQAVTVTGCDGAYTHLEIPEMIAGLPVRGTAPRAFAVREDLTSVSLPVSLQTLGRFTFYYCRNLKTVFLHDGITGVGDGVFRQCRSLQEIDLSFSGSGFSVMREILADTDRALRFVLHLPDGTAALTFPEYLAEYEEDTRARAMHYHIDGIGFSYRECVSRSGIDFRSYDRLFARVKHMDGRQAARIALDRLLYPYELAEGSQSLYEQYLRENAVSAVRLVMEEKHLEWLTLLTSRSLLDQDAAETGIRLASGMQNAEFVSILMNAAPARKNEGMFLL